MTKETERARSGRARRWFRGLRPSLFARGSCRGTMEILTGAGLDLEGKEIRGLRRTAELPLGAPHARRCLPYDQRGEPGDDLQGLGVGRRGTRELPPELSRHQQLRHGWLCDDQRQLTPRRSPLTRVLPVSLAGAARCGHHRARRGPPVVLVGCGPRVATRGRAGWRVFGGKEQPNAVYAGPGYGNRHDAEWCQLSEGRGTGNLPLRPRGASADTYDSERGAAGYGDPLTNVLVERTEDAPRAIRSWVCMESTREMS